MRPSNIHGVDTLFRRAVDLAAEGRFAEAADAATAVLAEIPDDAEALRLIGLIRREQGDLPAAINHLRRAAMRADAIGECHFDLADTYLRAKQPAAARDLLAGLRERAPDHPRLLLELGRAQVVLNDVIQAADNLERAAVLQPASRLAHASLGYVRYKLGDRAGAVESFRRAIDLGSRAEDDFSNLAVLHMELRQWDEAEAVLKRHLDVNPGNQEANARLGLLYSHQADYAKAIPFLRRAIDLWPGDARVVPQLVYGLAMEEDAREAVDVGEAFLRAYPDHPQHGGLYKQLAFAWLRAGEPEKALACCDLSLAADPFPTPALSFKYVALNQLGRRQDAAVLLDFGRLLKTKRFAEAPDFGDVGDFNRAIVAYIYDHPSLTYCPTNRSMHAGRGTLDLFDGGEHGPALVLKKMIEIVIDEYREERPVDPAHPFLSRAPAGFRLKAWGNIYDREGYQWAHFHPRAWLSGVYYPRLPASVAADDPRHEGWIEFGRPYYPIDRPGIDHAVRLVCPGEGMMVLFPSYICHRTIPVSSADDKRISIAFDVNPA